IRHPVGLAKPEHVAVELGHMLDVRDMKSHVAKLVRHNSLGGKTLARECLAFEHLHDSALWILERDQVGNGGIGVLLALCLDAVRLNLALEFAEIIVNAERKADAYALRL